jgi:AcrR family transcriptional regulator
MAGQSKTNRGPSAGPENRAALVAAARVIFGQNGVDAPLSSVAKLAGVGQGSLYRHFPDRVSLVFAVFDENMSEIEAAASRPDTTVRELADLITHQTEGIAALIGITDGDARLGDLETRLREALAPKWEDAQRSGVVGNGASLDELMMAIAMVAAVVTHASEGDRHKVASAAWDLLRPGLSR